MAYPAPHTKPAEVTFPAELAHPADPRIKHRLHPWDGTAADIVIIGVPYDEGVLLNGGRPGAVEGPSAFRQALLHFGTTHDAGRATDFDLLTLADAGDLEVVPGDPAATHERLAEAVVTILAVDAIPVIIGGGNDATFGSAKGLQQRFPSIGGVNIDAHLDMREVRDGVCHSGTPYRRIIEELGVPGSKLVTLGLHSAVNSRAHMAWAREQQVGLWGLERLREGGTAEVLSVELQRLAGQTEGLFVSIDLDVFAAAYAPGVSAPGTEGLTAEEGRALAFEAGRAAKVRLFELMELSPPHDTDNRTSRLAALLLHAFLAGFAQRQQEG